MDHPRRGCMAHLAARAGTRHDAPCRSFESAVSTAEMARAEGEASLKAAHGAGADFSGKGLNGLDHSGLDFSNVNFRAARMNKANFSGSTLDGMVLDQVWAVAGDFSGASLNKANLFASQMQDSKFDGDDLSRASLHNAKFKDADLAADIKNQSMGLMRAILKSADLRGADFENANLARQIRRLIHAVTQNQPSAHKPLHRAYQANQSSQIEMNKAGLQAYRTRPRD
jgi:uncharacterized protein YjbI with pentapeptide repeats